MNDYFKTANNQKQCIDNTRSITTVGLVLGSWVCFVIRASEIAGKKSQHTANNATRMINNSDHQALNTIHWLNLQ